MTTNTANVGALPTEEVTTVAMRGRLASVCLVGGAVAIALGRALTNEGGTPAERLHQVAGHQAQITVSALLAILGFAALVPGFLGVAGRVRRRGAALATVGAGLTALGCAGMSVMVAVDGFPTVAATQVSSTTAMTNLLDHLDKAPALLLLGPLGAAGYIIGPFLVALGAKRAGFTPAWLPWGFLVSLLLQPIALGAFGGPGVALQLLDALCQLVLVAMVALLARATLTHS
jgi:hypothetical protein